MGKSEEEPEYAKDGLLSVCFSLSYIYLFGMMKGNSTLTAKTNTISTNATYVNAAVAE